RGLIVPKHREVLGAYGAAVSVLEKMVAEDRHTSRFRGLDSAINDRMEYKEKICHADPTCHNQCKLKIYNFDGRRSVWGGECGRYEVTRAKGKKKENYFLMRQRIWREFMEGVYEELGDGAIMEIDGRPTVGMQRALYTHQTAVFWAYFFDTLGYRVVLTPPTNTQIAKEGIETMVAETCFPVKVSHGHVKAICGRTRYLFLPSLITMPTPTEREVGFYCPMVQSNSYMVRFALGLDTSNVLSPTVHLKFDPDTLAVELAEQISSKLNRGRRQIREAVYRGLENQNAFMRKLLETGRNIIDEHPTNEPIVVVTGRPYNLYDERVNLRLGQNLAKIGVTGLPMDFIDVSDVDLSDFPNMYWGLGSQIIRTAKLVRKNPRMFGLHLTNFSCGADSFLEHFYKHVMKDKAYLILELDEHSAVAGVMTRLEAFKNVIENTMRKEGIGQETQRKVAN
ncbi:MAG TPA: CoA activase, partial [Desulfobacterales bacterium]|nr:CoA activase [Desulfobacterales bacterium]